MIKGEKITQYAVQHEGKIYLYDYLACANNHAKECIGRLFELEILVVNELPVINSKDGE